jgi:hypothetical protein
MPDDASAPDPPPPFASSFGGELPLTTIESFIAALVEAGPEVAEHMVRAAQELLLAAQALVSAAERNLAEQRRLREQGEASAREAHAAEACDAPVADGPTLRSVDEVA